MLLQIRFTFIPLMMPGDLVASAMNTTGRYQRACLHADSPVEDAAMPNNCEQKDGVLLLRLLSSVTIWHEYSKSWCGSCAHPHYYKTAAYHASITLYMLT